MLSQAEHRAEHLSDETVHVTLEPLLALDHLAAMWRSLEDRSDARFFLSWPWISCWLATIDCRPDLLIARRHGEIVGLGLVLVRLRTRHRVMPVQTLFLHHTGDQDQDIITMEYNDFLLDQRYAREVRRACLRFLLAATAIDGRRVGELLLSGIDEALVGEIRTLGRPHHELANAGSAWVDLVGIRRSGQSYQDGLKPSVTRRIRRSMTLYQARGAVKMDIASTVEGALAYFEQAGALHQERWTAKGHPGAFAYPFYVTFHRRLIETAFPLGHVELVRVTVAGEPIGFLYNFLYRNKVYYYFSGFRFEDDNRLKPGLVCHSLSIERHLNSGMDAYDFMAGEQRYKSELGEPG
ncbi:MAG: GNAT family N-acetyltransferase, partial [Geminicoccaceae bacterium]